MNNKITCLDVRRLVTADPKNGARQVADHLQECDACCKFTRKLLKQEDVLREALCVPVPEGLNERLLLRKRLRFQRLRNGMAMAAAVLVAVAVVLTLPETRTRNTSEWAMIAAQHVSAEASHLNDTNTLSWVHVSHQLARFGVRLPNDFSETIGKVVFLENCPMPNGKGLHMVIDSPSYGRFTLIIPPPGSHAEPGEARYGDFYAAILPAQGISLAVIAEDPGTLDNLIDRFEGPQFAVQNHLDHRRTLAYLNL